jgi:hypothetical protein
MVLENLQYISIIIEVVVAIIGLLIFIKKKKSYGLGIFTTFFVYVFYDLSKLNNYQVSIDGLYFLFFIATLSMLLSVWMIYKENKINKKR